MCAYVNSFTLCSCVLRSDYKEHAYVCCWCMQVTKEREKEISDDEAEDEEKEEKKDDGDEDKEKVSLAL